MKSLTLETYQAQDFAGLESLTNIQTLRIQSFEFDDEHVSRLAGLKNLQDLDLRDAEVDGVGPILELPLKFLGIGDGKYRRDS